MTRVCPDCGEALEADEQFCGNCGCYLDWTEADEPAPVAEEPEPVAAGSGAPPRGLADRVKSALGVGEQPPPPPGAAGPPPPPAPPGRPVPATPPVIARHRTAERPDQAVPPPPPHPSHRGQQPGPPARKPAEALVVPVDAAAPQQPRAQQPGTPRMQPKPRASLPPPEPLNPGDLVCGNCGAGNKPSRKFCRRCGNDLAAAEVAKIPWWKRIFRRKPKVREAGSRSRVGAQRRGVPVKLFVILGILGVLGVGGFFLRGLVMDGVESVRDRVEGVEPRRPDGVDASSSQAGHEERFVQGGAANKYWAPAEAGNGRGEWVEVTFDDPVRLVYVLVTPGVSKEDEEAFQAQGRPADLRIVVDREGGGTEVVEAHLEDKRGAQRIGIGESDVTRVRFEITAAYDGNARDSRTAIGELEFWIRK